MSERLPGTAQYGERSFATAPEGGERASTARRSGGGGGGGGCEQHLLPQVLRPPAGSAPTPPHLAPRLGTAGSEPGPPTLVLCVFPASLSFAHTYGFPPLGPCRCGGRDGLASPDQAR